jgi:hypothetical protein
MFNLDHVSGLVCWAGRIENPTVGKDLGFRLKIPENDVTSLCPIKIDSGEMELIRKVGVDHISRASVIESAWPRILTYDKVIKYYGELDQRVKKILKREDRYVDYKENIEDCTNDKEELKHFTYCDFNQDINLRRYGFAKSMVKSLDKMSAVMFVKAHDELMCLDDEHKVTMPFLLRNMIWVLRPDIRPFFTDGKGGYRFVTIR